MCIRYLNAPATVNFKPATYLPCNWHHLILIFTQRKVFMYRASGNQSLMSDVPWTFILFSLGRLGVKIDSEGKKDGLSRFYLFSVTSLVNIY